MNRILSHLALLLLSILLSGSLFAQSSLPLTVPLPELLENQEVFIVKVDLAPGQEGTPHRHNAQVVVYVLSGEIEMQVNDEAPVRLTAGQTFLESPDDIHSASRNVSESEPASFLAFLVKEVGAPVSVPAE